MGKITSIVSQKNNKNRCSLFIDGDFFAGLSIESVYKYGLKVGMEILPEKLDQIISEAEKSNALARAIAYISKSLKTKRQVKDYLIKKGYSEEITWYCIDKLKEYNYIDDKEYSKRFLESTSKTQGKRLAEFKLMAKGVKKEDIETAYCETEIQYEQNALALCEKYLRNKQLTKENILKAYRYLISRGFSYEQADFAVSKFKENL